MSDRAPSHPATPAHPPAPDRPSPAPQPLAPHRPAPGVATQLLEHLGRYRQPPAERRIFVNRSLRMDSIRYVGFDLDWTLADYDRLPLEQITFELAMKRLIDHHGYPPAVRRVEFRPDFPCRGLLIDKEAGTVLRMSRHRFVNRAYLGRERLGRDELKRLYRHEPVEPASARFYHLDSLFELPEANLFAELVHLAARGGLGDAAPSYRRLFEDVRTAIDWVHAAGELKARVLADTGRFLRRDPELALALERLALPGRRRVLLTNSGWSYTDGLCRFLFDGALPGLDSWRQLFDLVVVEAGKPGFFRQRRPFETLDDGGTAGERTPVPAWGGVYRGGCLDGLMELIGEPGEHVLYVGDHIYGDVVSSKQESTWRTALVVRELEDEIRHRAARAGAIRRLSALQRQLGEMGHRMDHLRDVATLAEGLDGKAKAARLARARDAFGGARGAHHRLLRREARWEERVAERFSPYWGSLFKQGTAKTRFASQLETYACLYTSRASNFVFYGSERYFRVWQDPMMHELEE